MRKYQKRITTSSAWIERAVASVAEETRLIGELLRTLAVAYAANEKLQQKFRMAVLIRLSKIETVVQLIHGAQIVIGEDKWDPRRDENIEQHAKHSKEWISQKSDELGLKMVKYIYGGDPGRPGKQRKTQRK